MNSYQKLKQEKQHLTNDIYTILFGKDEERFNVETKYSIMFRIDEVLVDGCKTTSDRV